MQKAHFLLISSDPNEQLCKISALYNLHSTRIGWKNDKIAFILHFFSALKMTPLCDWTKINNCTEFASLGIKSQT